MRAVISIPLAAVLVLLATFNVWSMLSGHDRSKRPARWWAMLHRASGYGFIALFAVLSYFMLLRIRGWPDELSARIVLHMAFAFSLVPLLVAKVIAVRSRRASHALLSALGIAIYAVAFTLVTVNTSVHFLRGASAGKVPLWISSVFVFAILLFAGLMLASKRKTREPHSNINAPFSVERAKKGSAVSSDWMTLTLARKEPQTYDTNLLRFILPVSRRLEARPGQFLTFEWFIDGKVVTSFLFDLFFTYAIPIRRDYAQTDAKRLRIAISER